MTTSEIQQEIARLEKELELDTLCLTDLFRLSALKNALKPKMLTPKQLQRLGHSVQVGDYLEAE